ncbi:hypothetical protein BDM02DRAFT_3264312 [Thelephora ganbajun]|uniref:Uncharacterized protein n=1 Tax=Thelephora ganbajun TaxID=370292 RepID=A0ACB6Z0F5_THEGA|nr:hypothetical protein BDM02DRAFT_3264312 [Thelephora ganbajun]
MSVVSALAIVPLAAFLALGTEQIALRTSQAVGGLSNASLGNIVKLIIAGTALGGCDLDLVQGSLLGSLLRVCSAIFCSSRLLFLPPVGGFRFRSQEFQPMAAQPNSSLMTVSIIALVILNSDSRRTSIYIPSPTSRYFGFGGTLHG